MGNGLDPKSGTFPRSGTKFCAMLADSSVEIQWAHGRLLLK
jgi:hypothetical protein